jgi:putative ABC transport system ATP-binding protein
MTDAAIEFSNLSHAFGKGNLRRQVLFGLTGAVRAGEMVILTGPSGSGKTTLLTLLGTLRRVQEGQIGLMGTQIANASTRTLHRIRTRIGFIFQAHNLIAPLTAQQNLLMALKLHKDIKRPADVAREMLTDLGLGEHLHKYPHELSGGQRQRVAIGRALVGRPSVILADEPTASLDGKTGRIVVERLQALAKRDGTAIVLVTHDSRLLDVADRVVQLVDGRLAA